MVWSGDQMNNPHVLSTRHMVTELLNIRSGQSPVSVYQWIGHLRSSVQEMLVHLKMEIRSPLWIKFIVSFTDSLTYYYLPTVLKVIKKSSVQRPVLHSLHLFEICREFEMASAMAAASGLSEEVLERLAGDPLSCVERVSRYYLIFGVVGFI